MKKRNFVLMIMFLSFCFFCLTGCSNKDDNLKIAKTAEFLNWEEVHNVIMSNGAKADDYNGRWYIFTGMVSNIGENGADMFLDRTTDGLPVNVIRVLLSTDELKKLTDGQMLSVVGKFDHSSNVTSLKKAFVFPEELYLDDAFYVDKISYLDKGYTGHYFTDYEFDSTTHLPIKYSEISYSYKFVNKKQVNLINTNQYTLEYDDNGNVVSKTLKQYSNDGSGNKTAGSSKVLYTYNNDGFVEQEQIEGGRTYKYTYEKDSNGKVVKGIFAGIFGDTIYEYDNDGNVIRKSDSTTIVEYSYKDGRLIKEKSIYTQSEKVNYERIYVYGVLGKKVS